MERRGVRHQQPVGAGFQRARCRPRLPDIAADIEAEIHPAAAEHAGRVAAVEHALLVEHGMIRQVVLAVHRLDPAAAQQRCRVEQAVVGALGVADDQRKFARRLVCDFLQRSRAGLAKIAPQHQVFRRIAANRHFRRKQQGRACRMRLVRGGKQSAGVARDVADGKVDLRDGEFHRAPSASCTASPRPAGLCATTTPAASSARIFASAVPLPPAMIAPAWPMRLPLGAVRPAM